MESNSKIDEMREVLINRIIYVQAIYLLLPSDLGLRYPSGQCIGSWKACHEFEPSTTNDLPRRESDAPKICRELKRPLVHVVW
ncbi:hypothetical protein TNCV_3633541 [Trichonephila clavipes]|nr:hypothetical protein TNCV_3633541 [Trichonephila clavipes]